MSSGPPVPIRYDMRAGDIMRYLAPLHGITIDNGDAMRFLVHSRGIPVLRNPTLQEAMSYPHECTSAEECQNGDHGIKVIVRIAPGSTPPRVYPEYAPPASVSFPEIVAELVAAAAPQPTPRAAPHAREPASAHNQPASPASAPATSMATRTPKPIPKKYLSAKPGQIVTEELWLEDLSETKSKRIYCGFRRGRDDGDVAVIAGWDESVESVVRHLARLYGFTIADGPDALSYSMMGTVLRNPTLEDVIQEDDINNPRRRKGVDLMYRLKVNIKRG